jgi:hypothetical protein
MKPRVWTNDDEESDPLAGQTLRSICGLCGDFYLEGDAATVLAEMKKHRGYAHPDIVVKPRLNPLRTIPNTR